MSQHPSKIDVHHHFVPPFYRQALEARGGDPSGWTIPQWSVESSEELMSMHNIGTTILSMTAPGPAAFGPIDGPKLAKQTNDLAAKIRDGNPQKFGFFATLPCLVDNPEAALEEIVRALDVLHADGVTLFTRYGPKNDYLGSPKFEKMWSELNRRKAVVFIHPTHAVDTNLVNPLLPQPFIDYPHETTRTAVDLIMSETVKSNPHCKIILSHAGGTLPYLAIRAASMLPHTPFGKTSGMTAEDFVRDAKSFYFDLALSGNPYTLDLLAKFAQEDHILFGSDFPYAPRPSVDYFTKGVDDHAFEREQRMAIYRGNALKLLPRLQKNRSLL